MSRLKERTRYRVVRKLGRNDWLVRIGIWNPPQSELVVRLVRVQEEGEWFYYVTNLMPEQGFTPEDIRALYRMRWQVELFFPEPQIRAARTQVLQLRC